MIEFISITHKTSFEIIEQLYVLFRGVLMMFSGSSKNILLTKTFYLLNDILEAMH